MPSSSGSSAWSGRAGADIIDLDRYYRENVRPSRTLSQESQLGQRLVVDAGGIGRKIGVEYTNVRYKRHSQDSGVSDGSYVQRRSHRPHRRASNPDGTKRVLREPPSARTFISRDKCPSDSSRAFRSICEQTLIDQQKQLEKVAQLCERLAEQVENQRASERISVNTDTEKPPERSNIINRKTSTSENHREPSEKQISKSVEKSKRVSSDTSDISSSSRSTKDLRGKDINLAQKCKTYKIIMTKLDELNRRFSAHPAPRAAPHPAPRTARRPAPRTSSDSSVSVSDKLVATDPQRTVDRILMPTAQMPRSRDTFSKPPAAGSTPRSARPRVVTHAYNVDIAPREVGKGPNVTENVIGSSCKSGSSAAGDPRCGFDLEDPVHLYSQAKRLQALNASTRRAQSVEARVSSLVGAASEREAGERARAPARRARSPSLCSVCRGYWRSLRQCIIGPFVAQDCKCA